MKKKTIILVLMGVSTMAFSQVAIGKSEITKLSDNITPNPGISLEFGPDTADKRGVVLLLL